MTQKSRAAVCLALSAALLLAGCAGRELEDRLFPTVVTFPEGNPEAVQAERQRRSSKYLDYGQVRAVILEDTVAKSRERTGQVLEYLEKEPSFARSLLVFSGDTEVLEVFAGETEDTGSPGQEEEIESEAGAYPLPEDLSGNYLEDLYKNRPDKEEKSVTLGDLLTAWYNGETLEIPELELREGKLLPAEDGEEPLPF